MTASSTSWTRGSASHSSQLTHPPGPARPGQRLPVTLDPRPVPPQRRLRRHPQRDHHVNLTPPPGEHPRRQQQPVRTRTRLGVPACDAQVILGHSRLAVTLEIYTYTDDEAQLDALTRLHDLFDQTDEDDNEAEG